MAGGSDLNILNMLPYFSTKDSIYGGPTDAVFSTQRSPVHALCMFMADLANLRFIQFRSWIFGTDGPVPLVAQDIDIVERILRWRYEFEVGESIVRLYSVLVVYLHPFGDFFNKRRPYEAVDPLHGYFTFNTKSDVGVPSSCDLRLQHASTRSKALCFWDINQRYVDSGDRYPIFFGNLSIGNPSSALFPNRTHRLLRYLTSVVHSSYRPKIADIVRFESRYLLPAFLLHIDVYISMGAPLEGMH